MLKVHNTAGGSQIYDYVLTQYVVVDVKVVFSETNKQTKN